MELGIKDVGRWCFVRGRGWGVVVMLTDRDQRRFLGLFPALAPDGAGIGGLGAKWITGEAEDKDVTELGPWIEGWAGANEKP